MKIKIIVIIALFFCFLQIMNAQIDTEFWFVAPEVSSQHGDEPLMLRVTAFNKASTVKITQPANSLFTPMTIFVPANTTQSIDLTTRKAHLENDPPDQVNNHGIYITATEKVTAYYEVANQFNPEIFPLKGRNALGNTFYIPAQNNYHNQEGEAAIDIVATENNTTITITPSDPIVGHATPNVPFTITLNRGETYSLRATNTSATASLAGTFIDSDKPIAVTIMDDSIFKNWAYDLTGDQIVPVSVVGTEYIAVKGFSSAENVYMVATENSTDIFIDGATTPYASLNAGDTISYHITGSSAYISATKPIYALHLSGHFDEFGDALLPPIVCTGSDTIGFVRTSSGDFALMIVTEAGNEGSFQVNGSSTIVQATGFSAVPGTNGNWVAARYNLSVGQLPVGSNTITNSSGLFHVGILNDLGGSSEYGYFSNYSSLHLGDDIAICKGDTLILDAGEKKSAYLWNTGDTTQQLFVQTAGTYWVEATIYNCPLTDTIDVQVNSVDVDLGIDTSICHYDNLFLDATSTNLSVTYEWQDGSTNSTFFALDSGLYHVALLDTLGCHSRDSIQIDYNSAAQLGTDTSFVCDSLSYLLDPGVPSGNFIWQDGSTNPVFLVTAFGDYHVGVIDDDGCISSDSVIVSFVTSPDVELGNDTLICQGEFVVLDGQIDLPKEWVWQDTLLGGQFYTITSPGTYTVEAFDQHHCSDKDTIVVTMFLDSDVELGRDSTLCEFETVTLSPSAPAGVTYLWQDGSTDPTFTVEEAGTYILVAINSTNCTASDTVNFFYIPLPENGDLPTDTITCINVPVTLNAYQDFASSYYWDGFSPYAELNDRTDTTFIATVQGIYSVTVANQCGSFTHDIEVSYEDCSCDPFVPNAFTPNNDGNNDELLTYTDCEILNYRLSIFDRWGNIVFFSENETESWNGEYEGKRALSGVYVWRLEYSAQNHAGEIETKMKTGDVMLVR